MIIKVPVATNVVMTFQVMYSFDYFKIIYVSI